MLGLIYFFSSFICECNLTLEVENRNSTYRHVDAFVQENRRERVRPGNDKTIKQI